MPIYEYECGKCREKFEMLRKLGEDTQSVKCPRCGTKSRKLPSRFGGGASNGSCDIRIPT